MRSSLPAFTLIELLLAIGLCGLISSWSIVQGITSFQAAAKRMSDVQNVLEQQGMAGKTFRHIRGFSLVELMVALSIMTMAVVASALVSSEVPASVADSQAEAAALQSAYDSVLNGTTASTSLEDEGFKRLSASVEWNKVKGGTRSFDLSRIAHVGLDPSACDPFTSGDWAHAVVTDSFALEGGNTISSLAVTPHMLAIGVASTSLAVSPTLLFFSLSGTSTPQSIGSFDTASTSRIGNSAVVARGNYVFAGNAFSSSGTICNDGVACAQVSAYKVASSDVTRVSSLSLATTSPPYAYMVGGSSAPVSSLALSNGFLYAGLQKTVQGDEFNIINATDPSHLQWISGYPIGRTVTGISVRDGYAYATTDDPSRELMVFDVRDTTHPRLAAVWNAPGSATFGYGAASTEYDGWIRFGRTYSSVESEFELLHFSGEGVSEVQSIDSGTSKDPESVQVLLTQDRLTFMLLTHALTILDTHDPANISVLASYDLPSGSVGPALACKNNQLYVARNSNGQGIVDILQGP